jgi:hypothetical protein
MSDAEEPIRFLCDENFDRLVVEEVRKKAPALDIRTAADEGTLGLQDPDVLAYAADQGRILLTGVASTRCQGTSLPSWPPDAKVLGCCSFRRRCR